MVLLWSLQLSDLPTQRSYGAYKLKKYENWFAGFYIHKKRMSQKPILIFYILLKINLTVFPNAPTPAMQDQDLLWFYCIFLKFLQKDFLW